MAADAAERLHQLIDAGRRDPVRGPRARRRLAALPLRAADRALRPRPRRRAARPRLLRCGLRRARDHRPRRSLPRADGGGRPARAAQARRDRRPCLPLPHVDGQLRLLARARAPRRRDRRARDRRRRRRRSDRGDRPAARPADADRPPRSRGRLDRPRRHGRRAGRGALRRRPRRLAVGAGLPRRRPRRRERAATPTASRSTPGPAAVASFRRLVTTLRLFKAGGVGLGPYAWTRAGGDRWRRISTGAGRQRPGGYRLTDAELGDLLAFSRALGTVAARRSSACSAGAPASRPRFAARSAASRRGSSATSSSRRSTIIFLRCASCSRAAAPPSSASRCASPRSAPSPDGRAEVKAVVDRAIGLERELWSGEPGAGSRVVTPAETASTLEELARAILKDAAAGHLGSDLRATADEILLADGLAVGDGVAEQRGGTTEWDLEPVDADEGRASRSRDRVRTPTAPRRDRRGGIGARRPNQSEMSVSRDDEIPEQLVIERAQRDLR